MLINENDKIIENLKATMAMENCFLDDCDIELLYSYLNNDILENEAVSKIKSQFIN